MDEAVGHHLEEILRHQEVYQQSNYPHLRVVIRTRCKTKYKMPPSSVRSEGGEAAAGYCLNSVSYRVDEAVKYNVLNSD